MDYPSKPGVHLWILAKEHGLWGPKQWVRGNQVEKKRDQEE